MPIIGANITSITTDSGTAGDFITNDRTLTIGGDANVLVFPSLDAANIAYKLMWRFGGAEVIGPILLGMNKPVNVLQANAGTQDIVNLAAITAVRAQGELVF